MTTLLPLKPLSVRAFVQEDRPRAVRFWKERGFAEVMRDGGAALDVSCVDFSSLPNSEKMLTEKGILLRTLRQLETDPERDWKLCELYNDLLSDVPPLGERTPVDLMTFKRLRLNRPDVLPDAFFAAVRSDTNEYVGVSTLRLSPDSDSRRLTTGLTGVRQEYRRLGIAQALKLRGFAFASNQPGIRFINTWNAFDNAPILALNAKLGFAREPWRLHLLKTFES